MTAFFVLLAFVVCIVLAAVLIGTVLGLPWWAVALAIVATGALVEWESAHRRRRQTGGWDRG